MKIHHLPGINLTPEALMAQLWEERERIRTLVVAEDDDEDGTRVHWTSMDRQAMAHLLLTLVWCLMRALFEREEPE